MLYPAELRAPPRASLPPITGRRQLLGGIGAFTLVALGRAPVAAADVGAVVRFADGRTVRLGGIYVPDRLTTAAGRLLGAADPFPPPPLPRDRWGVEVGIVTDGGGQALQARLLRAGLALVDPSFGPEDGPEAWLPIEAEARAEGAGLWRRPGRVLVRAADAARLMGRFGIVRGTPIRVNARRRFTYLDFAKRWRDGYSLRVPSKTARAMKKAGLDLETLSGVEFEARGWVFKAGGPMIEIEKRAQIGLTW